MDMTDDEIREMIAAEERADSVYTCDYSREVARRMRLNPGDPAWLPKYDEVECPACGGSGRSYYDDEGRGLKEEEYRRRMAMTAEERYNAGGADSDDCPECRGRGTVEVRIRYDRFGNRIG